MHSPNLDLVTFSNVIHLSEEISGYIVDSNQYLNFRLCIQTEVQQGLELCEFWVQKKQFKGNVVITYTNSNSVARIFFSDKNLELSNLSKIALCK